MATVMIARRSRRAWALATGIATLGGLGFSACASAPDNFYALSAGITEVAPPAGGVRAVVVEPAALPDVVDRPQMVMKGQGNQVSILEQQRWAEPLRAGIPRVVAENLTKLLGTAQVSTRSEVIRNPDCRVLIDVRRFDSEPGQAVVLEALWTLVFNEAAPRRTGQSVAREKVTGTETDALVAAHSRALAVLSRDIAGALREGPPPRAEAASP
jgi:uncharacterized protein